IEGRVVKNGQAGSLSGSVQKLPVEWILVALDRVHAYEVASQNGRGEPFPMGGTGAAHRREITRIRADLKVFGAKFGGNRGGELAKRLAMLDERVQVLSRVRIKRRS